MAASSSSHNPSPTIVSNVQIVPLLAEPSSSSSDLVLIRLDADIAIPHYHHYYHVPLDSFHPKYYSLNDGTLLTEHFVDGSAMPKAHLFIAGALTLFFFTNSISAFSYFRRSRVKDKTLFYLLLLSQLLGLMSAVVVTMEDFDHSLDCTKLGYAKRILMKCSCDTMITGILGLKAYRCLSNSRYVLMFLIAAAAVMLVLVGIDLSRYQGFRTLYGQCAQSQDMNILSAMIMTVFVETTVLCGCFVSAIWKSYCTRVEARVAIRTPEEGNAGSAGSEAKESIENVHSRRGWWDYVPEVQHHSAPDAGDASFIGFIRSFYTRLRQSWSRDDFASSIAYQRKPSLPGEYPIPQPPRAPLHASANRPSAPLSRNDLQKLASMLRSTLLSPCPLIRRWIKYFSRKETFRRMLRNELMYTTVLAVVFLVMAILMLVGVSKQVLLEAEGWMILNWILISVFTMHSFSRVVRRHELEAVLQHPSAWERILRSEPDDTRVFFEKRPRRSKSPKASGSQLRSRHKDDDAAAARSIRASSEHSYDTPVSPYTITTPRSSRKPSTSSSLPSFHAAQPPSPVEFTNRPFTWDTATALPSPLPLPSPTWDHYTMNPASRPLGAHADAPRPSTAPADIRIQYDHFRHSFDLRTQLRTTNNGSDGRLELDARAARPPDTKTKTKPNS